MELLPIEAAIPAVVPTEINTIVLHINDETTAKYGIRSQTIVATIREHTAGGDPSAIPMEELEAIRVSAPDGKDVPVSDLAEIAIEKEPSHIVTRWPREASSETRQTTVDARPGGLR